MYESQEKILPKPSIRTSKIEIDLLDQDLSNEAKNLLYQLFNNLREGVYKSNSKHRIISSEKNPTYAVSIVKLKNKILCVKESAARNLLSYYILPPDNSTNILGTIELDSKTKSVKILPSSKENNNLFAVRIKNQPGQFSVIDLNKTTETASVNTTALNKVEPKPEPKDQVAVAENLKQFHEVIKQMADSIKSNSYHFYNHYNEESVKKEYIQAKKFQYLTEIKFTDIFTSPINTIKSWHYLLQIKRQAKIIKSCLVDKLAEKNMNSIVSSSSSADKNHLTSSTYVALMKSTVLQLANNTFTAKIAGTEKESLKEESRCEIVKELKENRFANTFIYLDRKLYYLTHKFFKDLDKASSNQAQTNDKKPTLRDYSIRYAKLELRSAVQEEIKETVRLSF